MCWWWNRGKEPQDDLLFSTMHLLGELREAVAAVEVAGERQVRAADNWNEVASQRIKENPSANP